ncbi:MAG: type II secretion system F family protein [Paracoccaceae bacterium]
MARFAYRALVGGEVRAGHLSAESREAAIARLRERRVVPLSIDPVAEGPGLIERGRALLPKRAPSDRDRMLFTRELHVLLAAGVPLDRALARLDRTLATGPLRGVAGTLLQRVRGGGGLADAMALRGDGCPDYYVGMVRAGEAGGARAPVLERLAEMLKRAEALSATLRSALTYPMIVLATTGLSLVILLVYVVPEFGPVFEQAGAALPAPARIVLAASDLVAERGTLLLLALLAALLGLRRVQASARGRERLDAMALRLPLFGPLVRRIETARFCRTLGTLRANGVALVEAVEIAAGTLSNRAAARRARALVAPLSRGEGLARPMRTAGLFPDLAVELVEIGEESGRLQTMLLQAAEVFDEEAERTVERALALIAPLATVVLGCLIAGVIGAILSAVLSSYDLAS